MQPESAMISRLHKPQKHFHGGSDPTPQGATNFPLHWLPHFSSPGTARGSLKVKLQWQMPMNCSSFLRRARWIHSRRRKKFPRPPHFRFSPRHQNIIIFRVHLHNIWSGLENGPCSVTHSVGGGCFWGTQRERSQNEQRSSSPRARYLGQLNQALATY